MPAQISKKGQKMKKENIFKQNLAESELPKFLNGMHKQEQKRFLEILNNENFELVNEVVDTCDDEWFFAYYVLAYPERENLFTEYAMNIIDDYAYRYNTALYENSIPASRDKREAVNSVWQEYTNFIKDVEICIEYKLEVAGDDNNSELIDEIMNISDKISAFTYSGDLEYFKCDGYHNYTINENRVDVVEAITTIKELVEQSSEQLNSLDAYYHYKTAQEIIENADSLLKKAKEGLYGAIINNRVTFNYLFFNDMVRHDMQDREL